MNASEFKRINETWPVVRAAWTINGKPVSGSDPSKWNYMRVKFKSGEEVLISANTVKEIGEMKWNI